MNLKRDEQRKEFICFSLGLTGRRVKQTLKTSAQINAGRGGRRVTTVSGSSLSASFVSLTAVNRSVQPSAAPLFICCSYASSYGRCGEGKEASLKGERLTSWCEETPSPLLSAHVSAGLDIGRKELGRLR